jgi:hypothetical protein
MPRTTYHQALANAKANAAYFGHEYCVYLGSDLQWHALGQPRDTHVAFALVDPDGTVAETSAESTVGELRKRKGA